MLKHVVEMKKKISIPKEESTFAKAKQSKNAIEGKDEKKSAAN